MINYQLIRPYQRFAAPTKLSNYGSIKKGGYIQGSLTIVYLLTVLTKYWSDSHAQSTVCRTSGVSASHMLLRSKGTNIFISLPGKTGKLKHVRE